MVSENIREKNQGSLGCAGWAYVLELQISGLSTEAFAWQVSSVIKERCCVCHVVCALPQIGLLAAQDYVLFA